MYGNSHAYMMHNAPPMSTPMLIKPVGIFWDIENCPVPKGKNASAVIQFIRNFFIVNRLNHREFEFMVACDVTKMKTNITNDINKAGGVTLAHVSGNCKNGADEKLREAMKKFVDGHGSHAPILIIVSGDIDFVNDLRGYQTRLGCTVIMIHGPNCSQHFKTGWNEIYSFDTFILMMGGAETQNPAAGLRQQNASRGKHQKREHEKNSYSKGPSDNDGSQISRKKGENQIKKTGNQPIPGRMRSWEVVTAAPQLTLDKGLDQEENSEYILLVSGLPGRMDYRILKENLQKNANKVHGKVKFVKNGQAFISFRKKENAENAISLFDGLKVYGKALNVEFCKSIPFENAAADTVGPTVEEPALEGLTEAFGAIAMGLQNYANSKGYRSEKPKKRESEGTKNKESECSIQ